MRIRFGSLVFEAPARPFAESVIRPDPAVDFEDRKNVAQVIQAALFRSPANDAELIRVDLAAGMSLKIDDRPYCMEEGVYIPLLSIDLAGVGNGRDGIVNVLMD